MDSNEFFRLTVSKYQHKGAKWCKDIPKLLSSLLEKWNLSNIELLKAFPGKLLYKCSLEDRSPAILKINIDKKSFNEELKALLFYKGNGCVTVFNYDLDKNAILQEQAIPGIPLSSLFPESDETATILAIGVIKKLHSNQPITNDYYKIEDWFLSLDNANPKYISELHLKKAKEVSAYLLSSQSNRVLLHGDLHFDNILKSSRQDCLAIDPKGVIGEIEYEIGALIKNPIQELLNEHNPTKIIKRRIEIFHELLKLDKKRLKEWSYSQAVLSACFAVEDGEPFKQWLQIADIIFSTALI